MKGLKEFIEDLAKDNKLREKFKDLKDVKKIVKLAKKEGYEFTEDEYMDKQMENVSGGAIVNCEYIGEAPKLTKKRPVKNSGPPRWMTMDDYFHGGKAAIDSWIAEGKDPSSMTQMDFMAFKGFPPWFNF